MQILIDNKIREYGYEAVLNLLREPDFVQGIVDGSVTILGDLTHRQQEILFETMELDFALA